MPGTSAEKRSRHSIPGALFIGDSFYFEGIRDMRVANPLIMELGQTSTRRVYDLLGTINLIAPDWQPLHAPLSGTGSNLLLEIPVDQSGMYIRSRVQRPAP